MDSSNRKFDAASAMKTDSLQMGWQQDANQNHLELANC